MRTKNKTGLVLESTKIRIRRTVVQLGSHDMMAGGTNGHARRS